MKIQAIPLTLALASIALLPSLHAQQSAGVLPPLSETRRPAAKSPAGNEIEVRKPETFSDQDLRVLHSIESLSTDRLAQMMLVYERLDNSAMLDVVVREVLRRDPKNKDALRIREGNSQEEVVRPAGYLDEITRKVQAGQPVNDPDSVPVAATSMVLSGRADEAVALLKKLRANQFKSGSFPYLDDLAYALSEAGHYEEAEATYRAVIADGKMSEESVTEARQMLPQIVTKRRIDQLWKTSGRDAQKLLAASARLLAEEPDNEDVQTFRVEVLQATHHYAEAVDYLLKKKKNYTGDGPWSWAPELGFCYFGARQFDKAIAVFREIQKDERYDQQSRDEAATMILEIQVSRIIEEGEYAMQRGDFAKAGAVLQQLERNYKTHRDVLGYRAHYLSRTGHSEQALQELAAARQRELAKGGAFSQQDALADVFMERKEFKQAREANLVILNDPRYDGDTRAEAARRMDEIEVAEAQNNVSLALRDGHRSIARAMVADLRRKLPGRVEVRMLEAEVALAYFQAKTARDELLSIKAAPPPNGFAGMPFDAQNSLAAALAMSGDWQAAYDAYGEVLTAQPFNYDEEDLWEARWERRQLLPWFRPTLSAHGAYSSEDEGSLFTSQLDYKSAWYGDWRYGVFARSITTHLKQSIFAGRGTETQVEGGVTIMRRLPENYFIEAMVGASEDDPLYGIRFGRLAFDSLGWSLGFVGNALSTDSVNLQALNGRENRVEFNLEGPITDRVTVGLNAWYQWNRVGGSRLGSGYGVSGELDYIIQTETRRRPEISIGYAFDYARFDPVATLPPRISNEIRRAEGVTTEVRRALNASDEVRRALAGNFGNEVFDSLVDNYTNRHGVVLKARKHFENHLALSGSIGAYYAFDDEAIGFTGSVAAEYWLSESAMIYAELRYDTNGKGASSNGGVWEANIGGQMSF